MRDLVEFVKFKKREKDSRRSVTNSTMDMYLWIFSRFLNCANGIKSLKAPHIALM